MNLYFLVEGRRTEKKVYARWLAHTFPALSQVHSFAQIEDDHYLIISGGGQPRVFEEIGAAIETICSRPVVDHLFICVDAEDDDDSAKLAEIDAEVARWSQEARVHAPRLQIHPIVQNCCIETWFLGNARMMRPAPSSDDLTRYKAFYDVRTQDPEQMESIDQRTPRAVFHGRYLKAMLQERSPALRYSKRNPGVVMEREYLDALRHRCQSTGHLGSLQRLIDIWDAIALP